MGRRAAVDWLVVTAGVITAAVTVAFASLALRGRPVETWDDLFLFHNGPAAVLLAWLGLLVLRRRPGNGAGRILVAIAVVSALHAVIAVLADARLVAAGYVEPARELELRLDVVPLDASVLLFVMNWLWVPAPVLMVTILPLVFPDGDLPSRRWWPVPVVAAISAGLLMVALGMEAWVTTDWTGDWTSEEAPRAIGVLLAIGAVGVLASAIAGFVALGVRRHRTPAERRRPFHVVGTAAAVMGLVVIITYPWQSIWIPAVLLSWYALLGAYALAVARFGLHDVEPFLGRAAVAAVLSALIAAVYAAIVIGVGSLAGRPFDHPLLPVVALAAVVLLIEPARRRTRRLVDRWLFRADADRTEVLSRVAAHANTSPSAADVVRDVTELLVRSTGAERVEAWIDGDRAPTAAAGGAAMSPALITVDITHHGARFGELRLFARARADLVGDAPDLVADVAHALGVVLRNEQLTARMTAQLAELRASRQRLIEAHDRGRRSLERDIHDGAQSRLIALRLRIGATRVRHAERNPGLAAELDQLACEVDQAVRSLRDLARGLAPPLLDEFGLATALRSHTRHLPIPVTVVSARKARYPAEIESAAYFCCLEAIQNAIRHSGAQSVTIDLDGDAAELRFEIRDDGIGFDPAMVRGGAGLANITDRIAALGGHADVDAAPDAGTRIIATIPTAAVQELSSTAER